MILKNSEHRNMSFPVGRHNTSLKCMAALAGLFLVFDTSAYANQNNKQQVTRSSHAGGGHVSHGNFHASNNNFHGNHNSSVSYNRNSGHSHQNYQHRGSSYTTLYPAGYVYDSDGPYVVAPGPDDDYAPDTMAQASSVSWVEASNGEVPEGAVVNGSDENGPTYSCMATYDNQTYNGVLIPNDGCYVEDAANGATIRLTSYAVLVANN